MTFNVFRENFLPQLEALLKKEVPPSAPGLGNSFCHQMATYHLGTGGKRIRGLIPPYVFSCLGHNPEDALSLGAAIETIHNATLVHDDLQDGDETRRGHPTVWKRYSSAQAINCGDALFQKATLFLTQLPLSPSCRIRLIQKTAELTSSVIEGQAQEFLMKEEPYPGLNRYLTVVRGKTSGLLALPFVAALEALDLPETLCRQVEESAGHLGVLFQIQDDLLDLYGNKGRNRIASDIAEGKISILVALFNEVAESEDKIRLATLIKKSRSKTSSADIQEVLSLFNRYPVRQQSQELLISLRSQIKGDDSVAGQKLEGILLEFADLFSKFPIQQI